MTQHYHERTHGMVSSLCHKMTSWRRTWWWCYCYVWWPLHVNSLRPRQNGRHFADDTFNRIFVNENVRISNKFSLKFVPKGPINNIQALVQIMAWRRPGDKPLSEAMMDNLPTHICVSRPQWVNLVDIIDLGWVRWIAIPDTLPFLDLGSSV